MARPRKERHVDIDYEGMPTVSEAIETEGNLLQELKSLRQVVAGHIDSPDTPPRDLGPLARRFQDLAERIAELEARQKEYEREEEDNVITIDGVDYDGDVMPFDPNSV